MRLLADECCHARLVVLLREAGHDVRYAAESDQRATDRALAELAATEDRIVVTADYDFGELAVRHLTPVPGIVIFAPTRANWETAGPRAVRIIGELGESLRGSLTIIEERRVRTRPLVDHG